MCVKSGERGGQEMGPPTPNPPVWQKLTQTTSLFPTKGAISGILLDYNDGLISHTSPKIYINVRQVWRTWWSRTGSPTPNPPVWQKLTQTTSMFPKM
jgi:hypothetical protein